MEDAYGSHEPSSTVNRFTSVSKENTLHISPGQEKISLYLAGVLGNPLEVSADSEGTCCGRVAVV